MKRFPLWLLMIGLALALGAVTCTVKKPSETGGSTVTSSAAPEVTFKDLQGHDVPFSSLKGKVVLVNFWATWCEPCQMEIPWLIDFQQKYASRGFTVLGVAMDDDGAKVVAPFVQDKLWDVDGTKMKMNYPIVIGSDEIGEKFGGLLGLPTSVLVSRDGKMVKRTLGLITRPEVDKEIQGQLQ